uniref:Aa_trans domain-containing protein n=1 Tax=Heterorhabditis bacteriophora TaxID=37862 RepID=A0A1I7WYQ2_HETBA
MSSIRSVSSVATSIHNLQEDINVSYKSVRKSAKKGYVVSAPTPLSKIYAWNKDNWLLLIIGTIGCIINGSVTPVFSLVYSQMISVSIGLCKFKSVYSEPIDQMRRDVPYWSCMFIVLGLINAVGFQLAVGNCSSHSYLFFIILLNRTYIFFI